MHVSHRVSPLPPLKKAIIKYIPKEAKTPQNLMNYGPISLKETHGKLHEKIIQGRLNVYPNDNTIIKDRKLGYRSNKGTTTAITYESIANSL